MLRRLVAATLALAAVSACSHGTPERAPNEPTPIVAAPNAPAWSGPQVRALQQQLRSSLGAPALATSGVAIVDADGRPLFERRERAALTPASTFKVLVGVAALATLGPGYRFPTTFESIADPRDGRIDGDLYLVGSGDPTLTRDDLRGGAGTVARDGVREVGGSLVADAGAFSGPETNPAWDPADLQYGYAAGTSALSVDQGTVEFHLVPTVIGAPARIRVLPPSGAVRVFGSVLTSYTTLLTIQRDPGRNDFTFAGRVAAEQSFWRPVIDLPRYAAEVARAMLRDRGVAVDGGVRVGHRSGRTAGAVAPPLPAAARDRAPDVSRIEQPFRGGVVARARCDSRQRNRIPG